MKKPSVLFVDDDKNLLDGIKRSLRKHAIEVVTADSADLAMYMMKRSTFHLVISDEAMKGMSGSDFLVWVNEWFPKVPRIMLSGQPNVPAMQKLINDAKIFRFLMKPIDNELLVDCIYDALEPVGFSREAGISN